MVKIKGHYEPFVNFLGLTDDIRYEYVPCEYCHELWREHSRPAWMPATKAATVIAGLINLGLERMYAMEPGKGKGGL